MGKDRTFRAWDLGDDTFIFEDGIWNHLTLMVPGTKDCFFVKPHGILMSEVTASSLIVANFDGKIVEGRGEIETTAYCIHAQFHKMHPKGTAVLHSHPYYATWLCMTEPGRLLPIHQDFMVYLDSVAYDDNFEGQGSTLEEGARMAKACTRVAGDSPEVPGAARSWANDRCRTWACPGNRT